MSIPLWLELKVQHQKHSFKFCFPIIVLLILFFPIGLVMAFMAMIFDIVDALSRRQNGKRHMFALWLVSIMFLKAKGLMLDIENGKAKIFIHITYSPVSRI